MLLINRIDSDYEELHGDGTSDRLPSLSSGEDLASEAEMARFQKDIIGSAAAVPLTEAAIDEVPPAVGEDHYPLAS